MDHDAIKENSFNYLPKNIIDLAVADKQIDYNTKGVSFNPLAKKDKIAVIVVGSILAAVVILIAVFIIIDIRKKNKEKSNQEENTEQQQMTSNEEI